jgi:diguanylate cyclase (GGDEF)-like protein
MAGGDPALFAAAAQQLAKEFGSVTATAVTSLWQQGAGAEGRGEHPALFQPGEMRRRLEQLIAASKRYEHPFALVVFDVDVPAGSGGEKGGAGRETGLVLVGAALRESVRVLDETFRLEDDALCVLAPNQDTVGGVQMSERLLGQLDELEEAGGLSIGITAGVVACPDHGEEAELLLRKADEAMWRARSVGQPVGVGALEPGDRRSVQDH